MQYASRKDIAHGQISRELKDSGFCVVDLSRAGGGIPDLLVGRNGVWVLVEIKTPRGLKAAPERRSAAQIDWHAKAKGPVITAYNSSQVVYDFNMLLKRREGYAI